MFRLGLFWDLEACEYGSVTVLDCFAYVLDGSDPVPESDVEELSLNSEALRPFGGGMRRL